VRLLLMVTRCRFEIMRVPPGAESPGVNAGLTLLLFSDLRPSTMRKVLRPPPVAGATGRFDKILMYA
jgi:hypothetical protein